MRQRILLQSQVFMELYKGNRKRNNKNWKLKGKNNMEIKNRKKLKGKREKRSKKKRKNRK